MPHILDDLSRRLRSLEKEVEDVLEDKEQAFRYRWEKGKARFEDGVVAQHRRFKQWLPAYILGGRVTAIVTAPVIYLGVVPFALLDLFLAVYQGMCFPVYGIPKAKRSDYLVFDRGALRYLNLIERLNCVYCSYGNGVLAWGVEIAARTEQHWCPVKHARKLRAPHSRYPHFLDFGDAEGYRRGVESIRNDFVDIRSITGFGNGDGSATRPGKE